MHAGPEAEGSNPTTGKSHGKKLDRFSLNNKLGVEKALQLGLSKQISIVYQNEAHVKQWHYNIHETVHEIAVT